MYHAKQSGRNAYKFFAPAMNAFAHERLELETGLRRALQENELVLHYQPKVDIDTGAVVSLEALVRWRHPTRAWFRRPSSSRIAEECGLIGPLGEWVLRTACAQNRAWQDAGLKPMRVAVNVSAKQFRQTKLLEFVRSVLEETGLEARYLELELTESTVMSNAEESVRLLKSLSDMGVHIAIDDFGTGYSSLAYLKRLPLNVLKVDRVFRHRPRPQSGRRLDRAGRHLDGPQPAPEGHRRRRRDPRTAGAAQGARLRPVPGLLLQHAGRCRRCGADSWRCWSDAPEPEAAEQP